jgi:hypothetical protein
MLSLSTDSLTWPADYSHEEAVCRSSDRKIIALAKPAWKIDEAGNAVLGAADQLPSLPTNC